MSDQRARASIQYRLFLFLAKVGNGLRFFPFTLVFLLAGLVLRLRELRSGLVLVHLGRIRAGSTELTRNVMVWFTDGLAAPGARRHDVCLCLPADAALPTLHESVSALLAFPQLRSVALYWDDKLAAEEIALWQNASRRALPDDLDLVTPERLRGFLKDQHAQMALPVAIVRDAETFLKREIGSGWAVCFNFPTGCREAVEAFCRARPDTLFMDFGAAAAIPVTLPNYRSTSGQGRTLHERMALVGRADAYIGAFDELGCTAVISGRPAVLIGGDATTSPEPRTFADRVIWLTGPHDAPAAPKKALQF